MDKLMLYEIRIEGHLSSSWSSWFEDLEIQAQEDGDTIISGPIADQAALHGLLAKIRDLGLFLVEIKRYPIDSESPADQLLETP